MDWDGSSSSSSSWGRGGGSGGGGKGGGGSRKKGRGRGGGRGGKNQVVIQGLPSKYGDAVKTINALCGKRFSKLQSQKDGSYTLTAKTFNDAQEFAEKLDGGSHRGSQIRAQLRGHGGGGSAFSRDDSMSGDSIRTRRGVKVSTKGGKKLFVHKLGVMNLSGVADSSTEKWVSFMNRDFVNFVLTTIQKHCRDVETLDLSGNDISSLEPFEKLARSAPSLRNLALKDNPIQSISQLNYLNRLPLCELLLFNENMLNECGGSQRLYTYEVCTRFPLLDMLDGNSLSDTGPAVSFGSRIDQISQTMVNTATLPVSCHCPSSAPEVILGFVRQYVSALDQSIDNLAKVYHPETSMLTVTFLSSDSPTPRHKSDKFGDTSRSLSHCNRNWTDDRFKEIPRFKQMESVHIGSANIVSLLKKLVKTNHGMSHLCVDCNRLSLQGQDIFQVHCLGYFQESKSSVRKFQRTFVIGSSSDRPMILNDQWHIGGSVELAAVQSFPIAGSPLDLAQRGGPPGEGSTSATGGGSGSSSLVGGPSEMDARKKELVSKVAQHCKVSEEVAAQALSASDFNPETAITRIRARQGGG